MRIPKTFSWISLIPDVLICWTMMKRILGQIQNAVMESIMIMTHSLTILMISGAPVQEMILRIAMCRNAIMVSMMKLTSSLIIPLTLVVSVCKMGVSKMSGDYHSALILSIMIVMVSLIIP